MESAAFVDFEDLDTAVARLVAYGRRKFPNRSDYEQVAEKQERPNAEAAWSDPSFAAAVMRHWHMTGQTGCLFARRLADVASHGQWQTAVFAGESREELDESIRSADLILREAIESSECEIVSLLFPDVVKIDGLRAVCDLLVEHTGITIAEDCLSDGTTTVAMRLDLTGDGTLAWVMAFGPLDAWPPTRRAPVLEFAIRVKPKPSELFRELNQDPSAAHLADTDPQLSEDQMEKVFERTKLATRDVLGSTPDRRSAAKTTFSFPAGEWEMPPPH